MKDVGSALRKGYIDTILAYDDTVRIYDEMAPDDAEVPYIILSTQTESQMQAFTGFLVEATMLVDCITTGERIRGKKQAEDLANIVTQAIVPENISAYMDLSPTFKLLTSRLISSNTIFEPGVMKVYRKLLRFSHIIEQL